MLTLNVPIATKVVCFSRLLKCLKSLYGKQCGPRSDCSCSGSTLFASILNSSVMLGNYLQRAIFSDAFFFLGALRVNLLNLVPLYWKSANSAEPDQTSQNAESVQVLHCLLTECTFKI